MYHHIEVYTCTRTALELKVSPKNLAKFQWPGIILAVTGIEILDLTQSRIFWNNAAFADTCTVPCVLPFQGNSTLLYSRLAHLSCSRNELEDRTVARVLVCTPIFV